MNRPTLAVYCFGHDLERIKYPYLASIQSALSLTEEINGIYFTEASGMTLAKVYYCDCDSTDDSLEIIQSKFWNEIGDGNLVLLQHPWGTHHTIQAHICNYILDQIDADYALKLDADEVIHEDSFEIFKSDLKFMRDTGSILGRPNYTHFSPDFDTTFPFIYNSKAVISVPSSKIRFEIGKGGDACALGGAREIQTHLEIFHYGKVDQGREREALYKEVEFTKLYYDMGFPDPKVDAQKESGYLDYEKVFDNAKKNGEFQPFTGTHPIFLKSYIERMRERSKRFWETQK